VEAFWSPALASRQKYAGKSSRCTNSINYRGSAGEDLSLSGGASIQFSIFFKLSITSFRRSRLAFKRRRRPSRVALASSCYAAWFLAEAPPSEGWIGIEPATVDRLVPARRFGRGGRRDQAKGVVVDLFQHRMTWLLPRRKIVETSSERKSNLQKDTRWPSMSVTPTGNVGRNPRLQFLVA
jgi:hypothetical protein